MSVSVQSDDRQRRPVVNPLADELLAVSAADRAGKVIIVGQDRIDLLLALFERGFTSVDCLSAVCGPRPRRASTDVVLAPAVRSECDLQQTLHRFGGALRPHGVLVVREAVTGAIARDCRLRQLFLEAGFAAVERRPARGGGCLWCAFRDAASLARAA